jgi:signal transduction histidine kinase
LTVEEVLLRWFFPFEKIAVELCGSSPASNTQPCQQIMIITDFGDLIAARMRAQHEQLAARWFERLVDLLPVGAHQVFPSTSLLDHVPSLILEISTYLRSDQASALAADSIILDKARDLGALRYEQQASLHQVLREYQILGGVLVQFVAEEIQQLAPSPPAAACVQVLSRIHQAVDVLSQTTVEAFVALYLRTIADQTERLDQFTRMATHEWRQPMTALQFGIDVLRRRHANGESLHEQLDVMQRSVAHLVDLTQRLEAMARLRTGDTVVTQRVPVHTVAREAARQLREMAAGQAVDVRVTEPMPDVTVDVGRLELALVNLLSNAIKYCDPAKDERYVEILAAGEAEWCRLIVRDNGLGIPRKALDVIFQRFTRVHREGAAPDGVGLGLSIVDDCVRAMGGTIEVASEEGVGSTFTLSIPTTPRSQ